MPKCWRRAHRRRPSLGASRSRLRWERMTSFLSSFCLLCGRRATDQPPGQSDQHPIALRQSPPLRWRWRLSTFSSMPHSLSYDKMAPPACPVQELQQPGVHFWQGRKATLLPDIAIAATLLGVLSACTSFFGVCLGRPSGHRLYSSELSLLLRREILSFSQPSTHLFNEHVCQQVIWKR